MKIKSLVITFTLLFASYSWAVDYYPNYSCANQGAATTGCTASLLTAIGASKDATIVFRHNSSSNTTTYTFSSDVSIPATVRVKIENGAILSVATGKVLTIGGYLDAWDGGVFTGLGTFTLSGTPVYNVKWRGAVGDASTDDATAINAAATDCATVDSSYRKQTLWFPNCVGYATTTAVTIPLNVDVQMDAPIIYAGNATAITVGDGVTANFMSRLKLWAVRSSQSDWTDGSIGIKLYEHYNSQIEIVGSSKFTYGVYIVPTGGSSGEGNGFAYNEIYLGYIVDNRYGLYITSGATYGWTNENNWYGGRFACSSNVNLSTSRNAIVITSGQAYYNNHNVFYKPSFELNYPNLIGGATSVSILATYCSLNEFVSVRSENSGTTIATVSNNSYGNVFNIGYGAVTVSYSSATHQDDVLYEKTYPWRKETVIYQSLPLNKVAGYYNATYIQVPGLHMASSSAAGAYIALDLVIPYPNYLYIPSTRGVGIFVDTTTYKRFVVRKGAETGYGGRVLIRCYDSAGTVLTSAGAGHPYVKSTSGNTLSYSTNFGGVYSTGVDSVLDTFFAVGDDVKKMAVIIAGGTSEARLHSFSISSFDSGRPNVYAGHNVAGEYLSGDFPARYATQAPVKGCFLYGRGSQVWNARPTTGGDPGWVCIFRLDTTLTEDVSASETADITLASIAGVQALDIVEITLDDGTIYTDTVADVVGGDLTLTGAGPVSLATSGNAVRFMRWEAMGHLH